MCRLRNIALLYKESVNIGQTFRHTDRQTPDKVIPMCRYGSQATQKNKTILRLNPPKLKTSPKAQTIKKSKPL